VWALSTREFLKRMSDSSELALAIIRRLARELQQAGLQAEILSMKTVAARLDARLGWRGTLPLRWEFRPAADFVAPSQTRSVTSARRKIL
jgi:CRP-like cAMP-binding protein